MNTERKQSAIEVLAGEMLDERELQLASHLSESLSDPKCDAASLVEDIVPVYSDESGKHTLDPDPIYRPFMYLHDYPDSKDFAKNTRIFILNACWHIEGCLAWLTPSPPRFRGPKGPFGKLVDTLKQEEVIPLQLADQLMKFNKAVYVPAHHPSSLYTPKSLTDERTFSIHDAALAFVMMRKLSMQLFQLLESKGINLPHKWKNFGNEWLL